MLSLCANASFQPWPPLFNGFINDALLQLSPDTGKALLQIIDVPNRCLIDAFLYQPPDPVFNWIEVCWIRWPDTWRFRIFCAVVAFRNITYVTVALVTFKFQQIVRSWYSVQVTSVCIALWKIYLRSNLPNLFKIRRVLRKLWWNTFWCVF